MTAKGTVKVIGDPVTRTDDYQHQFTYFDNGHPLAGMCIETISILEN